MRNRLFGVPPNQILEHPTTLPVASKDIPEGPIKGWDCFAPQRFGNFTVVKFEAIVRRSGDRLYIEVGEGYTKTQYWYDEGVDVDLRPNCPCWFQSGSTLRFIASVDALPADLS